MGRLSKFGMFCKFCSFNWISCVLLSIVFFCEWGDFCCCYFRILIPTPTQLSLFIDHMVLLMLSGKPLHFFEGTLNNIRSVFVLVFLVRGQTSKYKPNRNVKNLPQYFQTTLNYLYVANSSRGRMFVMV